MKVKCLPEALRFVAQHCKAQEADPSEAAEFLQTKLRAEWGWDVSLSLARDFLDAA